MPPVEGKGFAASFITVFDQSTSSETTYLWEALELASRDKSTHQKQSAVCCSVLWSQSCHWHLPVETGV